MSNDAVWTDWLPNPGTGECPVPEWAEYAEMIIPAWHGEPEPCDPESCIWGSDSELPISHYRYRVPADLAWLAENVVAWPSAQETDTISNYDLGSGVYTKDQWLRARRDLGYEQASGIEAEPGEGDYWEQPFSDPVHHPSHYMLAPELEAIDVIRVALTPTEFMGYLKGSILKYRLRAGRKGEAEQDIAKSDWYRERALEMEEKR